MKSSVASPSPSQPHPDFVTQQQIAELKDPAKFNDKFKDIKSLKDWIRAESYRLRKTLELGHLSPNTLEYKILKALSYADYSKYDQKIEWKKMRGVEFFRELAENLGKAQSLFEPIRYLTDPELPPHLQKIFQQYFLSNLTKESKLLLILAYAASKNPSLLSYLSYFNYKSSAISLAPDIITRLQDLQILPKDSTPQMDQINQLSDILGKLIIWEISGGKTYKKLSQELIYLLIEIEKKKESGLGIAEIIAKKLITKHLSYNLRSRLGYLPLADVATIHEALKAHPSSISEEIKEAHQRLKALIRLHSWLNPQQPLYLSQILPEIKNAQAHLLITKLLDTPTDQLTSLNVENYKLNVTPWKKEVKKGTRDEQIQSAVSAISLAVLGSILLYFALYAVISATVADTIAIVSLIPFFLALYEIGNVIHLQRRERIKTPVEEQKEAEQQVYEEAVKLMAPAR